MDDVQSLMERIGDLYKQERKQDAARLLPSLITALTGSVTAEELATWPVCATCLGTGELNDVTHEGRKLSCITNPQLCQGNQMGRMSPRQFAAFMSGVLPALDATGVPVPLPPKATVSGTDPQPTRPGAPGAAGWASPFQAP